MYEEKFLADKDQVHSSFSESHTIDGNYAQCI